MLQPSASRLKSVPGFAASPAGESRVEPGKMGVSALGTSSTFVAALLFGSLLLASTAAADDTSPSRLKSVPGFATSPVGEGRVEPGKMGVPALGTSSTFEETRRGLRVSPTNAPSEPSSPAPCAEPASAWQDLCDPPWMLDAAGVRRVLPECLMLVHSVPTASFELLPATTPTSDATCQPPYHIDSRGIQRLLPECLTLELPAPFPGAIETVTPAALMPSLSCELPYRIDAAGIRRLIVECVATTNAAQDPMLESALSPDSGPGRCEPPYRIDASGIRRLRPECL